MVLSLAEPNTLKILPIIPFSTSPKFTHYSYFILISLVHYLLFQNNFPLMFQVRIDI